MNRCGRGAIFLVQFLEDCAERPLWFRRCRQGLGRGRLFLRDIQRDFTIPQTLVQLLSAMGADWFRDGDRILAEEERRNHPDQEDAHRKSDFSIRMHPWDRSEDRQENSTTFNLPQIRRKFGKNSRK